MKEPKTAWRIDPAISGGGLFHDIAPHQLDLAVYFFGNPLQVNGRSDNIHLHYLADDYVQGEVVFENGVFFNGEWNFAADPGVETDRFIITGTNGFIEGSVFTKQEALVNSGSSSFKLNFDPPVHVQKPMIEAVTLSLIHI